MLRANTASPGFEGLLPETTHPKAKFCQLNRMLRTLPEAQPGRGNSERGSGQQHPSFSSTLGRRRTLLHVRVGSDVTPACQGSLQRVPFGKDPAYLLCARFDEC
jgi:hypothetical protein